MVKIPIDVWEVIRHTAPARLDLVDSSDEELRRTIERQVDERIAEYERAKGAGGRGPGAGAEAAAGEIPPADDAPVAVLRLHGELDGGARAAW